MMYVISSGPLKLTCAKIKKNQKINKFCDFFSSLWSSSKVWSLCLVWPNAAIRGSSLSSPASSCWYFLDSLLSSTSRPISTRVQPRLNPRLIRTNNLAKLYHQKVPESFGRLWGISSTTSTFACVGRARRGSSRSTWWRGQESWGCHRMTPGLQATIGTKPNRKWALLRDESPKRNVKVVVCKLLLSWIISY